MHTLARLKRAEAGARAERATRMWDRMPELIGRGIQLDHTPGVRPVAQPLRG